MNIHKNKEKSPFQVGDTVKCIKHDKELGADPESVEIDEIVQITEIDWCVVNLEWYVMTDGSMYYLYSECFEKVEPEDIVQITFDIDPSKLLEENYSNEFSNSLETQLSNKVSYNTVLDFAYSGDEVGKASELTILEFSGEINGQVVCLRLDQTARNSTKFEVILV